MRDLVVLSCPNCGGRLEITPNLTRFACGYCGTQVAVHRGGGVVALEPVVEGLARIQSGTDRTAAELAINRLQNEIRDLRAQQNSIRADVERARADTNSKLDVSDHIAKQWGGMGAILVLFGLALHTGMGTLLIVVGVIVAIVGVAAFLRSRQAINAFRDIEDQAQVDIADIEDQITERSQQTQKYLGVVNQ